MFDFISPQTLQFLQTGVTFFVILSILVFIHELGHFLTAKKLGMRVEEFGFGLPPRIWGKKVGETIYSINWLPIGGFVRIAGEDMMANGDETDTIGESRKTLLTKLTAKQKREFFWARSKLHRTIVLLAGVTMNFLLAVLVISYIFTQGVFVPTDQVHVEKVTENSPASEAGLMENDVIIQFGDTRITNTEALIKITSEKGNVPTPVTIVRNGEELVLTLTPRKDPPEGEGPLGIVITNLEEKKYAWYEAPFYGMIEAVKLSWFMISTLAAMVWRLITFQGGQVEVAGPLGIAQATGQAIKEGYMAVLQLAGLLSLNLAIFNALPIPALDGGRLFFVLFEDILGKRIKPKAEAAVHQIGMLFLLSLVVLVTINDILRIVRG
ncbi:RIP metalloprotease RseP [Candidatus Microgenomates bacterium]|nr:MAG: RIP metalloprotease RseP [Candidatus Microgenomates bacterium]